MDTVPGEGSIEREDFFLRGFGFGQLQGTIEALSTVHTVCMSWGMCMWCFKVQNQVSKEPGMGLPPRKKPTVPSFQSESVELNDGAAGAS